jgi:hypothetical protein
MSQDHCCNNGEQKGTQAMKRSNQQFENARWARIAAGDSAHRFLVENFAPETAIATAVSVEYFLSVRWETEQEQMRARRDPHMVFEISIAGMAQIRKAFDNVPLGQSNERAEQYVIDLLTRFPADQAWWTAHRVKEEVEAWFRARRSVQEAA